jgi:hypothetical protein
MKMTLWFIDARCFIASLNTVLVQNSTDSLQQKQLRAGQSLRRLGLVEDVLYAYMVRSICPDVGKKNCLVRLILQVVLGDTLVLWRVYAFWHLGRDIIVLTIPAAVYFGSIGTPSPFYCQRRAFEFFV